MSGEFGRLNGASVGINADNPLPVTGTFTVSGKSATGTPTAVTSNASSVTVLASNANRLGATIVNDSTSDLYLLLETGGTASTTVFTIHLPPRTTVEAYYEVPFGYTGDVIGIWSSAQGHARVTEFTT